MITVLRCSGRTCEQTALDQLPASLGDVGENDVIWIDLAEPTPEEEQAVLARFGKVHELTLEDVTKPRREPEQGAHLPKVEEFPDYLFVIVNPLPRGIAASVIAKPPAGAPAKRPTTLLHRRNRPQLSTALTANVIITHHYQPLDCIDGILKFCVRHGTAASRGPDYIFHLILDQMVDEYAPVVDRISARLDRMEAHIFRDPSPQSLQKMLRLKRLVTSMRKTLILEREVLARLIRHEFALVTEEEIIYYRNVYDHLVRYSELIESAREMVSDLMQSHLSASSNKLNAIMKVLTTISTIVLPMTLIAGIYGMNFEQNVWPDLKSSWGFAFAIATMAFTGLVAYVWFRWKKWT